MALTASQYRDEAEAALTKAKGCLPTANATADKAVAWTQIASTYGYLFELQSKIDKTITV
jgi:hypothetical protein